LAVWMVANLVAWMAEKMAFEKVDMMVVMMVD
jgi:hypothetical protein